MLGDTNQVVYDLVLHREPPTPSLTDAFWLPAYPLLAAVPALLLFGASAVAAGGGAG